MSSMLHHRLVQDNLPIQTDLPTIISHRQIDCRGIDTKDPSLRSILTRLRNYRLKNLNRSESNDPNSLSKPQSKSDLTIYYNHSIGGILHANHPGRLPLFNLGAGVFI